MGAPEHVGKLLNTPPNGCTFPVFITFLLDSPTGV